MEFVAYLAPIAFVFALAALAQVQESRKKLTQVNEELALIRNRLDELQQDSFPEER